ncbi:MAG: hypothetical protein HY466_01980 [Deltaproteobacteria bacterium]|nr:hypothetical protein [Deltaproteobacteria bacterium]
MIEAFFKEMDERWNSTGKNRIGLPIIGSTALFLQSSYDRGTKDSDVLEVVGLTEQIKKTLLSLAGPGTRLAKRHKIHLDIVGQGIPFLPHPPLFHPLEKLNRQVKNFQIEVLDITDVVVSKLKTFRAQDVDDIRAMVLLNFVDARKLVQRFLAAKEYWLMDARSEELPQYIQNLNTVLRDFLEAEEIEIELPPWI